MKSHKVRIEMDSQLDAHIFGIHGDDHEDIDSDGGLVKTDDIWLRPLQIPPSKVGLDIDDVYEEDDSSLDEDSNSFHDDRKKDDIDDLALPEEVVLPNNDHDENVDRAIVAELIAEVDKASAAPQRGSSVTIAKTNDKTSSIISNNNNNNIKLKKHKNKKNKRIKKILQYIFLLQ